MRKVLRNRENAITQRWLPGPLTEPELALEEDHTAELLIIEARREAERILTSAYEQAEQTKREAHAVGLAQGQADGLRQYEAGQVELRRQTEELIAEQEDFFIRMEPELVRLTVAIAEKVIGQQLTLQPELVVEMARGHLKRIREREVVNIRVHPDDLPLLSAEKQALIHSVDGIHELHLTEDRRVGDGGMIIETAAGSLDGRIATKLSVVRKGLEDALGAPHDATHD